MLSHLKLCFHSQGSDFFIINVANTLEPQNHNTTSRHTTVTCLQHRQPIDGQIITNQWHLLQAQNKMAF